MKKKNRNRLLKISIILISLLLIPTVSQFIEIPTTPRNLNLDPKLSAAPLITIDEPSNNQLFGSTPPTYSVWIRDPILGVNKTWYTIDEGITNITFTDNGTINPTEWSFRPNGTVTIIFYANDTAGIENSNSVTVRKDIEAPVITITSPSDYDLFGTAPPPITIDFNDGNLDERWYQLDNGTVTTNNYTWTGSIAQSVWDQVGNGTVTILFYANDTFGNENSNSVIVYKDINAPVITITSPFDYDLFGTTPPPVTINFNDGNLDERWYQLDNGTVTTNNYTWTGSIAQSVWDQVGNGTVTIIFYANDTFGNENSDSVIVYKDIRTPIITITSPSNYDLFGDTPPPIIIAFTDPNIDERWYQLDNGTVTTNNYTWTGSIAQGVWDQVGNGTVTIIFYANDTAGNENSNSVIVYKDIRNPVITLTSPSNYDLFGDTPPLVIIAFTDPNLDERWYQLDNGTVTTNNYTWTGSIAQGVWDQVGNGTVTIIFYANDTAGNENSNSVIVYKDIRAPVITITSPSDYDQFGSAPPPVIINFNDGNLDERWYQLDNGTVTTNNYTWTGSIAQSVWDQVGNGTITIHFYANDTFGNENSNSVIVYKDINAPVITITSPSNYDLFGDTPPPVIISFIDPNIDERWYQLDNGTVTTNNYTWTGSIAQSVWDQVGNGTVTIIFYANDTLGNENSNSVIVYKDIIAPVITITSPSNYDLFESTPPPIIINFNDGNLDERWYQLDNGTVTTNNYTWTGSIAQSVWDQVGNGTITIIFYANDTLGNENSDSVIIYKDIVAPVITITSPSNYDQFGSTPPPIIINFNDGNLDERWYQLDNGTVTTNNYTWTGSIAQSVWDQVGNGTVTILFYANDTLGNENFDSVIVYKDINAPIITLTSPSNYDLFGDTPPPVIITFTDPNIDERWYQLDNGTVTTNNYTWTGSIAQSVWDQVGNGTVTILFYANDTLGNENSNSVIVYKDIIAPVITLTSPSNYDLFGDTPPPVIIAFTDPNLDERWYQLDDGTVTTNNYTWTGSIAQSVWDQVGNGTVTILFYANDTLGNENSNSVIVYKDINAPVITITSPSNYDLFGNTPPSVIISFTDPNLDERWYQLDNGTVTTNNYTWTGIIAQSVWDQVGNGTVTIIFYANDTLGNENSNSVIVYKDINAPTITINLPISNDFFGATPPDFAVSVSGENIDTTWYSLDNGTTNYIFIGLTGIINQTAWDNHKEGPVWIRFYINNSAGNIGSDLVIVIKDTIDPTINIISPNFYDLFGTTSPLVSITFTDPNLDERWYQLDDGTVTTNNYTWTGSIAQSVWDQVGNGTVTIIFYANDTAGNENSNFVIVYKDAITPLITINTPADQTYWSSPPSINVTAFDANLEFIWYIVNGQQEFLISNIAEDLRADIWSGLFEGTFTIEFYANDSAGNINNTLTLILYKDTINPMVVINTPSNESYWNSPPLITVTVYETNFDTLWYRANGITEILTNNTGELLLNSIWTSLGEGPFQIEIFANDTTGKLNDTYILTLYKDTIAPKITINAPLDLSYWDSPPPINITVFDINFVSLWYKVGVSTELLINSTEELLLVSIWNSLSDGSFQLEIIANDSAGNINNTYILTLYKDVLPPDITIDNPLTGTHFTSNAPIFNLTIIEVTPDTYWYSLYNGTHWSVNIYFTGSSGIINQSLWDSMPYGEIMIRFFANDSFGRIGSANVTVYKQSPTGFNLIDFLTSLPGIITMSTIGVVIAVIVVVVKKKRGGYKSKDKEIKRIEEIRRKAKEELRK